MATGEEYDRASKLIAEVLADQERVLRLNHPHTLRSRRAAIQAKLAQNSRPDEKLLRELREVTQLHSEELGDGHYETLRSRHVLAKVLLSAGELDSAEELLHSVASAQTEIWPTVNHPDILSTRETFAELKIALGDIASARKLLKRVVAGRTAILGIEHPLTKKTVNRLSSIQGG